MNIFEELDAQLEEINRPEANDAWEIRDMDAATWASRKAAAAAATIDDVGAWERREIERIKTVADAERGRAQSSLSFFTNHLGAYLGRLVHDGRKTKSLDLPGGRVALRNQPDKLDIADDAAIEWAQSTYDDEHAPLKTKVTLDRRAFRAEVDMIDGGRVVSKLTGEVLDFARWTEGGENVYFQPEAEAEA